MMKPSVIEKAGDQYAGDIQGIVLIVCDLGMPEKHQADEERREQKPQEKSGYKGGQIVLGLCRIWAH